MHSLISLYYYVRDQTPMINEQEKQKKGRDQIDTERTFDNSLQMTKACDSNNRWPTDNNT